MDTLCGIGLPELIIVALLGFVVIGPTRSRELAVQLGSWLGKAMRAPWWREFQQVTDALRNLPTTLVRMAELEEVQADLRQTVSDIERQAKIDDAIGSPTTTGEKNEISDPWGIQNATAETRHISQTETDETPDDDSVIFDDDPLPPASSSGDDEEAPA